MIDVEMRDGGSATEADIERLSEVVGRELPADYLGYLRVNDGAYPEENVYGDLEPSVSVENLIPAKEIPELMESIDGLPCDCFPFASAHGGDYLVLSYSGSWTVQIFEHEFEQTPLRYVAGSFSEFLSGLRKFRVDSDEIQKIVDSVVSRVSNPNYKRR